VQKRAVSRNMRKQPRVSVRRKAMATATDSLTALTNTLSREVANPAMVMAVVLCALLAITHAADPASSMVTKLADWLVANPATKVIGEFVKARITATVGAICYTVTVMMVAPMRMRGQWLAIGIAFAYLVPESSVYQYVYQCLLMAIYLRARRPDVRTIIIVAGLALYVLGVLTTGTPASPASAASATARTSSG